MVGTGKFSSNEAMVASMEGAESEIVTVALRRVDVDDPQDSLLKHIDPEKYLLLPNTSGARDAEEAIRLARIARAAGCDPWVKLEVTPDPYYLLPDPIETLKAAEVLVKEGFIVLPYINADPVLAKHLQEAGTATVMPLGAPLGPNKGVRTRDNISNIIEQATALAVGGALGAVAQGARGLGQELAGQGVVVDDQDALLAHRIESGQGGELQAHGGATEEGRAARDLELAAVQAGDGVLAVARDPGAMGVAFKKGVEAGREAYLAGLGKQQDKAEASSPLTGFLHD